MVRVQRDNSYLVEQVYQRVAGSRSGRAHRSPDQADRVATAERLGLELDRQQDRTGMAAVVRAAYLSAPNSLVREDRRHLDEGASVRGPSG